jgi:DNA primase
MENKEISFQQFTRNLNENTLAQKYFKSRGLSKSIVKEGLVGFCPAYSRYSFPLLRGRLIVPIRDVYGKTIALAGRQIPDIKDDLITSFWDSFGSEPAKCQDRISKWTKGKWINEPYVKAKNLFFLDQSKKYVREKNYIILVEGYFDVYSLYDNGIKNVAAICGTSISEYQIALASRFCDNIVILMDSDFAGKTAANKIVSKVEDLGLKAYKVYLPVGMDPDDFAKNYDTSFLDDSINSMIADSKKELYVGI